jgi:hypothetical protein
MVQAEVVQLQAALGHTPWSVGTVGYSCCGDHLDEYLPILVYSPPCRMRSPGVHATLPQQRAPWGAQMWSAVHSAKIHDSTYMLVWMRWKFK